METLGMKQQGEEEGVESVGTILLPPVMGAQIELIMTCKVLEPHKVKFLQTLNKMLTPDKNENWFTIYLCLFILLHSCAMYVRNEEKQARKHGLEVSLGAPLPWRRVKLTTLRPHTGMMTWWQIWYMGQTFS